MTLGHRKKIKWKCQPMHMKASRDSYCKRSNSLKDEYGSSLERSVAAAGEPGKRYMCYPDHGFKPTKNKVMPFLLTKQHHSNFKTRRSLWSNI